MSKLEIKIFFILLYCLSFYLFIGDELLPFISNANTFILLAIEMTLICLGLIKFKYSKIEYKFLFLLFLVTSTITYFINSADIGIIGHLNGLRAYLVIFSLIYFMQWVFLTINFISFLKRFDQFTTVFLWAQIPTSIYQFIKYGAGDHVGGTLSNGYSGVLSCLLILFVMYKIVMTSYISQFRKINSKNFLIFAPFLFPTFINETKITFLLLPILFVLFLRFEAGRIGQSVLVLCIASTSLFGFNQIYQSVSQEQTKQNINTIFTKEFVEKYFFNENTVTSQTEDVGRFERFGFYNEILKKANYTVIFGKGFGLFKGAKFLGESEFTLSIKPYVSGSNIAIAMMYLEGGWINTLIFILLIIVMGYRQIIKIQKEVYLRRLMIFSQVIVFISLFYNSSLFFCLFIAMHFAILILIPKISIISKMKLNNDFHNRRYFLSN